MLDRNSPIPLYHQLRNFIIDKINCGEIKPDSKIPTIKEISETYKLSRITVTKAFENLKNEGYLYSIQGSGFFVKKLFKIEKPLGKVSSFSEEVRKYGLIPSSEILECKKVYPSIEISRILNIKDGDQITYIHRVRKANDEPLTIDKAYVNDKFCPGLIDIDLSINSIYEIFRNRYKLALTKASQFLESVILFSEESKIFALPINQPGFLVKGTVFLSNGQPLEYCEQLFRGDRYKFVLEKEEHMNSWVFTNQLENGHK